jgi:hypothetical protein
MRVQSTQNIPEIRKIYPIIYAMISGFVIMSTPKRMRIIGKIRIEVIKRIGKYLFQQHRS